MGHLLFLDESGLPWDKTFVLGGIAVGMSRWQLVCERWRREHPDEEGEPKCELKWSRTQGSAVRSMDLIAQLRDAGMTAFAVIVDTEQSRRTAPALFSTPQDVYATALMFLAERFQHLLERVDSHGLIVIDGREPAADDKVRRFFARIATQGTEFRALDRLVTPILMTPSHFSLGIQAADLVVGPLQTLSRSDGVSETRRSLAAALHERVLPFFDRHPHTREINGVGIKRFPDLADRDAGKLFATTVSARRR